jgi:PPM family protein phosphatase
MPSEKLQPEKSLHVNAAARTDVGRKRGNNEDSHVILALDGGGPASGDEAANISTANAGLLLAVADGMGGREGGEVASSKCIEILAREIPLAMKNPKGDQADPAAILEHAVIAAHQAVYALSQQHEHRRTMGTTLTAAMIRAARAHLAQVGDSRAYLFRQGKVTVLTQDQTYGTRILEEGGDPAMLREPIREALTQALGAQREIKVVMSHLDLEPQDLMLFCCDGLYKVVVAEDIEKILGMNGSLQEKAEKLVGRANDNGGPDNITVLLAEFLPAGA